MLRELENYVLSYLYEKLVGKLKDEKIQERKQELEKRLLHVNDQIGSAYKQSAKREENEYSGTARSTVVHSVICLQDPVVWAQIAAVLVYRAIQVTQVIVKQIINLY